MTRRTAVKTAIVAACAAAVPFALLGLLWALLLWSPEGLDAFSLALLALLIGWRCAWLHGKERTEGRAP